jgi:hypothetical protein
MKTLEVAKLLVPQHSAVVMMMVISWYRKHAKTVCVIRFTAVDSGTQTDNMQREACRKIKP